MLFQGYVRTFMAYLNTLVIAKRGETANDGALAARIIADLRKVESVEISRGLVLAGRLQAIHTRFYKPFLVSTIFLSQDM